MTFLPDGRIAITLRNTADVPVAVGINAPLGIAGAVKMVVPDGRDEAAAPVARRCAGGLP